jgi:DNA replication protein DnaC
VAYELAAREAARAARRPEKPGSLEAVDPVLARVDGGQPSAAEAISTVLEAQISLRDNRRLEAAMRPSRLPAVKTLSDIDFGFQPSLEREQIESLTTLGFVKRKENVVFLGPPGVGKPQPADYPSR